MTPSKFAALIGQAVDDLSEREVSRLLQVSRATVNRWKNGRAAPHPLGRPRVLEILARERERRAK